MKGFFERSREDAKLLLSKLGFAVSLPLAAYLIVNSNQPTSPSVSDESGAVGKSADPVSTGGGRNLKDVIHIQESEEELANIIHGTHSTVRTTTTMAISSIKDHSASSKNSWAEEECLLAKLNQLSLQDTGSSLMRLGHRELEAKKVDMEQAIAYIQGRERIHVPDYYGSKKQQDSIRELEDQLKISMMKAKSLSLRIHSLNEENQMLRIQDSEYSGTVGDLESVVRMIKCLVSALKSDRSQSTQKMAALEQRIIMLDDKNHKDEKDDPEVKCELKMLKQLEDEYTDLTKTNSSMEQNNSMLVQKLEFADNLVSSCGTPKAQEVEELEANCLEQANEKVTDIEQLQDDHSTEIVKVLHVSQIDACLKCEQRNCDCSSEKELESYTSESLSAKTEEKAKQILLEHANLGIHEKNIYFEDFDTGNYLSQQTSNESMNNSSDLSSTMNNNSVRRSKHQSSHRIKLFSKLKKILLGKHSHKKGNFFVNDTPISCSSSDTGESVSTCCFDDARSNSCDSTLMGFPEEHASTNHLLDTRSTEERWRSNTAWCQSCFRSPFQNSRAKIFDVQEEDIGACFESNQVLNSIKSQQN